MASGEPLTSPAKPLLRGWLHAIGAVAALVTTSILLVETAGDQMRFLSLLVFGLSMILLYVVSAVYCEARLDEQKHPGTPPIDRPAPSQSAIGADEPARSNDFG